MTQSGKSPLMGACGGKSRLHVMKFLIDNGADINDKDVSCKRHNVVMFDKRMMIVIHGRTPFIAACSYRHNLNIVK